MIREDNIRRTTPYTAGEQPKGVKLIKLNTNENPYPPAPGVREALKSLSEDPAKLRLYPDMDASPLVDALAEEYGISPEEIFVGIGSDDVLSMCFLTFFNSGRPVLFPDITYSFYDVWAEVYRIPYITVPLSDDFTIRTEDYLGTENGGVVIANPNAPTGVELPLKEIRRIIEGNPENLVIVDEAYVDFGAESALPLIKEYDNLIVVQTFSKSRAMAGMRIGYAMGCPELIRAMKDVKFSVNSYTMNLPSIIAGTAAARDHAYLREITGKIIDVREHFEDELEEMGFCFARSRTNFVFARHPLFAGAELKDALRERGILVRHFAKPRIEDYLRITIGTREEMEEVASALREIIRSGS